jgi:hypothetical protein
MVLPDAATVFIERDVQGPMELLLDIPMLADHRDEGRSRPHQAGKGEAVVTGDRRVLVRHPNRFHDHDGLEARPFRSLWEACQVCDGPAPPPYRAAMRVIEGITEVLGRAPGQLMFDVLMKVLFDRSVGLFVVALQGQERGATWVPNVRSDGRLTAHRIHGHHTTCDGEQLEEVRHGGNLIGLFLRFALAYHKATLLGTPGREPVQGRGRGGPIEGGFDRFAIQRDACPRGELCDGLRPGHKALLKMLRIETRKDPAKGIMGGNPMGQGKKGLEPGELALPKEFPILEPFSSRQEGTQSNDQHIEQVMLLRSLNTRVLSRLKMLDDRCVDRDRHSLMLLPRAMLWGAA